LASALSEAGIHETVDVVPNHMAIDGRANRWWWDVLENGPSSIYASYFDIDWLGDGVRSEQTVLVPLLGDHYGRVLDAGEVSVIRQGGAFTVCYFDHELPVSPRSLDELLHQAAKAMGSPTLDELATEFGRLPHAHSTDPEAVQVRHEVKERLRDRLDALCQTDAEIGAAIDRELERINADPDRLDALLRRQNFRLAFWRVAHEELDYRRFFNIETLVGLRVEREQVFADSHVKIAELVRRATVDGLRVDHVDGLRDPEGYLHRLRRLAPDAYLVVEKILAAPERLPAEWPIAGTTGYDFVARVNNLMVDPSSESALTGCYSRLTGEPTDYRQVEKAAKYQVVAEDLAPEVERLARMLFSVCDGHRYHRDRTRTEVRAALQEVLAAFPVYRTYVQADRPVRDEDRQRIEAAVKAAEAAHTGVDPDLIHFIGELLLLQWPGHAETEFALSFPQLSAPVMAKGAEDTAFYRYNRLVSLNEVGGDPGVFGRPLEDFYEWCTAVAERWPATMLALGTHDTKRSPDVRARINLLSELAEPWEAAVTRWLEVTDRHTGPYGPDANTRYLMFQTLVGAWPIPPDRLAGYMQKAVKEGKVHTSWTNPNSAYEEDLRAFVERTVHDPVFTELLESFLDDWRIDELGVAAALAQTALLLTCPGVPDIYQGGEQRDDRLVDPDNRRPVDFAALRASLAALDEGRVVPKSAPKLWLMSRVLRHRRERPEAYAGG
ncbi:MAG: malto-oligosyltrehalose synthase, partial [Acidimicrobiales bacterium]|nr:malto-oligosyltrehalose synthase [Acidimicrobiales bacterium]